MKDKRRSILIIGGGIAGLCAAVYSQQAGYQVEVLEQHNVPGGLATSWRRDEYTFETCLHWLVGSSPNGALHSQWQEVFDIDKLTFIQPDEYLRFEDEHGQSLSIYRNVDKLESEFVRVSPQDREEVHRFASAIRRLVDFPLFDMSDDWCRRAFAFLRMAPQMPLLARWSRISGDEYSRRLKHPLLKRFFTEGTSGRMPPLVPVFMLAWMSRGNAGYPIGGSSAVIGPIVERLRNLGGRLRLGAKAKVETILVENDTAVGVRLAGGETIMGGLAADAGRRLRSEAANASPAAPVLHGRSMGPGGRWSPVGPDDSPCGCSSALPRRRRPLRTAKVGATDSPGCVARM